MAKIKESQRASEWRDVPFQLQFEMKFEMVFGVLVLQHHCRRHHSHCLSTFWFEKRIFAVQQFHRGMDTPFDFG